MILLWSKRARWTVRTESLQYQRFWYDNGKLYWFSLDERMCLHWFRWPLLLVVRAIKARNYRWGWNACHKCPVVGTQCGGLDLRPGIACSFMHLNDGYGSFICKGYVWILRLDSYLHDNWRVRSLVCLIIGYPTLRPYHLLGIWQMLFPISGPEQLIFLKMCPIEAESRYHRPVVGRGTPLGLSHKNGNPRIVIRDTKRVEENL